MLKLSQPITSINGFKIGDKVRLKDGDGRPHFIKSFSIDGIKEFFFVVQFVDGTEAMLDNISPLPSNLDDAAEKIASDIAPTHPDIDWDECFEKIKDGIKAGAEWMAGQFQKIEGKLVDWYETNGVDYCCGISTDEAFEVPEGFYIKKK